MKGERQVMRRTWSWRKTTEDIQAREEASDWLLKLERDESPPGFAEWLTKHPRNIKAILDVSAVDREMTRLVRKIHKKADPKDLARPARLADWWRPVALAASVICIVGAGVGAYLAPEPPQITVSDYRTEIGEQRLVTLPDGSEVRLNTQSHLQLRFTREGRDVDLLSGEALFNVAKDRERPFRVHADSAIVQAVGTRFNVDKHADRLFVTVFDGSVRVALPGPPSYTELTRVAPLQAGEMLEVQRRVRGSELHITMPAPEVLARRASWASGILTFVNEPLANVVAEMNRYNRKQIVIDDPAIAGLLIGGRFTATDLRTFVDSLPSFVSVEIEWPPDARPIRLRKPKSMAS